MDCFVAEFIIGPARGGTRWLLAMTRSKTMMIYEDESQKEGPPKRAFERAVGRKTRSGGLAVDLGEVVLRGLGTVGDELAEIFGGGLRPRDENFAARTDHVRLDLDGFVDRLGRSQLVDAGEERFRILIERLLDGAADFGGLGDRTGNGGVDRGGHPFSTAPEDGGADPCRARPAA